MDRIPTEKLEFWRSEWTEGLKEFDNINFQQALSLPSVLEPHLPSLYLILSHLYNQQNPNEFEASKKDAKLRFEEKMELFKDYLFYSVSDLRISNSLAGWLFHLYYSYWALSRIAFFQSLYYLPWTLLDGQDRFAWLRTRPWTLVDVTGVLGAIYYVGFAFLPRFGKWKQLISYYGTIAYGNSLFMTWFLVSGNRWFLGLNPSHVKNQAKDLYSSWSAVYTPLLHFMLFSFLFQTQIRLSCWILSQERQELFPLSSDRHNERSRTDSKPGLSAWHEKVFFWMDIAYRLLWRPCFFLSPLTSFFIYYTFARPLQVADALLVDCTGWPYSTLLTLLLSVAIASFSGLWLTFLTFQIQYVFWHDEECTKGLCIFHFEKELSFGCIY